MTSKIESYEPLGAFVLVKLIEEDLAMVGGIVLPDIAKEKSNKGRVIAVGEGQMMYGAFVKPRVEPGDIVLCSKYGGTDVKLDGEDYILIRYDEIYLRERKVALVSSGHSFVGVAK
jgi:chaperonin GroES